MTGVNDAMSLNDFWRNVDECVAAVRTAPTVEAVIDVLNAHFSPSAGDAFYGGSGGTDLYAVIADAPGWSIVWSEADYFFVARDAQGGLLTYVEGDVYRGDQRI